MSELQVGLIVLGVVVVGGVYLYNRLQERRFRRETGAGLDGDFEDVLLGERPGDERREPSIEPAGEPAEGPASSQTSQVEPAAAPAPQPAEPFDAAIHFVVAVRAEQPVAPDSVHTAMRAAGRIGRAVTWVGRDHPAGPWVSLAEADAPACREVWSGILLADRSGPARGAQLESLCEAMAALADRCGGSLECGDVDAAAEAAQRLDAFCAEVDVQVGVNLVPADGQAVPATRIRGLAEANGFRLDEQGMFRYIDDSGRTLFVLSNKAQAPFLADQVKHMQVQGLTLLLDVASAAQGVAAFDRMAALSRSLATTLGWVLVDDRQAPLDDAAIAKIRSSLGNIYARMEGEGIPVGSARALRLFA